MRILILGPVNSAHVEHPGIALHECGHEVNVLGWAYQNNPSTALTDAGVSVTLPPPEAQQGRLAAIRWLRSLIRDFRPDIVHAHWLPVFGFWAALAGARPLVSTAWGSDLFLTNSRARIKNRFALARSDIATADSPALVRALVAAGGKPDRVVLLQWGVELDRFHPPTEARQAIRQRLGLPDGRIVLGPRALRPLYNPRLVIEAFERVADDFPDVHLVLKHLEQTAPPLGPLRHADRVHVIGHVAHETLPDYYRAADVCVSVPKSDSAPRTVWEAMACGTPCVLSDLPWVHDMLVPDEHALVVPIDPGELHKAIVRLLTEERLGRTIAANARKLVESSQDRASSLDQLTALYERLANRTGRRTPRR